MTASIAETDPNPSESSAGVGPSKELAQTSPLSKIRHWLRADWLRCLVLTLLAISVRSPALQGQRIWDDQYLIIDNPFIKSPLLLLETFRHYLFLDSYSPHYRPIQNISFFLDYFFWNTDEFGFHLTNVLLHAGSGVLLYLLLRRVLGSIVFGQAGLALRQRLLRRFHLVTDVAFAIALIWAVHPVHSAAIDYISGRADSLAFVFAAGGWLLFWKARERRGRIGRTILYCLAPACALVALLSREIAFIWIILFLLHLFSLERTASLRLRLQALICCVAVIAVYAGLRQLPAQRPTFPPPAGFTPPVRAVLMARALGDYTRLTFWPTHLHMERTVLDPASCFGRAGWASAIGIEYLSILGLAALAVLIFGSAKTGRGQVTRCCGAAWFLLGYLPISNLVQLNATVAEHWLYLPSVGLLIFVAGWVMELPARFRPLIAAACALAVIGLGVQSFSRSGDWASEETFYTRTFNAGSRSARVAVNLGHAYANNGRLTDAERIFRMVLEQNPDYPIAQNNLADVLYRQGKKKEAEALFAEIEKNAATTRKDYPRTWIGAMNLATLRHNAKDDDTALAILERGRKDYPEVWELVRLESEILRMAGQPERALHLVKDFADRNWWQYGAALAIGRLYTQQGVNDRAEAALRLASWLDIHDTEALRTLVMLRLRQHRLAEACQAQRRAVARQPDEPRQYVLLSNILEQMGRQQEAQANIAKASQLRALVANGSATN